MIAIDFSMSSPGICIGDSAEPDQLEFGCFRQRKNDEALVDNISILDIPKDFVCQEERFWHVADSILKYIQKTTDDKTVFLEDYSFGSKGAVFNIAEATGALKQRLWQEGYTIIKFAPSTIKKFATGKGNANKTKMYETFFAKTGYNFNEAFSGFKNQIEPGDKNIPSPIADLVDAYFILQMGLDHSTTKC